MRIKQIAFFLILSYSCGDKTTVKINNIESIIELDLQSEAETKLTKLSEFAKNIEYIKLQTIEGSLTGASLEKIVCRNGRIYIQTTEKILCFNRDGTFLNKLESKGKGPEEYPGIEDFDVSSDNKFLLILSGLNHKLLIYGISQTGFKFQRSVNLKEPAPYRFGLVPGSQNVFLAVPPWRGNEQTLSLLINTAGDTIHFKTNCYKYELVRKMNYRSGNETLVYSIGDMVCFKELFSDTVFCVNAEDNHFKPRLIFNTHGTLTTPEVRGGSEPAGNRLTYIANIFETQRYIFYYYFSSGPTRNRILFDKKTNTGYRLNIESELTDDINGGPDYNIEFLNNYCSSDKLFSFVEAIDMKKYIASSDFKNAKISDPNKKDELKKLADSLNETDNPVLIIVTPKE